MHYKLNDKNRYICIKYNLLKLVITYKYVCHIFLHILPQNLIPRFHYIMKAKY